jgi:hypothetical protein
VIPAPVGAAESGWYMALLSPLPGLAAGVDYECHSQGLRPGLRVSRRCGWLSHKRCDRSHTDRSNPTRAGPCPCGNPCSNFPQGKVRSQRRTAMAADGGARQGQFGRSHVFGPSEVPRSVARRSTGASADALRGTRYGWSPRLDGVTGGFAWTQWLTTLTGESPTPSPGNRGKHVL